MPYFAPARRRHPGQALFAVALGYGNIELLEDIIKGLVRYLVPLNSGGLPVGYNIASRSVDFFEGISRTDQHILEFCNAVLSVMAYSLTSMPESDVP